MILTPNPRKKRITLKGARRKSRVITPLTRIPWKFVPWNQRTKGSPLDHRGLLKSPGIAQTEDTPMEPQRGIRLAIKEIPKPAEKARSFKAILLNERKSKEGPETIQVESGFDDSSDDEDMGIQDPPTTKSRIRVNFSKDHLKRIRQQYKDCLIIKLLGKNMGFKTLMSRISALWNLDGLFTPVELGLGFYLIRFESKTDYNKVFTGGPWVIQDHYLTVQKWQPDFKADKATAIKTAVWMRFPFLPYEYYDEESLFEIAKELGKPLKVDINTIEGIRASYARVSVELDLSQPLEVSVAIRNEDYLIEYEHIHLICFDCGRVGHRKESCSSRMGPTNQTAGENPTVTPPESSAAKAVSFNGNPVPEKSEEIGYGEWMVVSRRKTKKIGPIGNGPQGPKRVQAQNGKGPAQNVSISKSKASTSSNLQYRPKENHRDQTLVQQGKREGSSKQASNGNAQEKLDSQQGVRYEFNPLLRKLESSNKTSPPTEEGGKAQSDKPIDRPIFSPVSDMEVILDIPNPTPASHSQPPFSENSKTTPLRKPPDIIMYHEFARATECNRELSQGEHGDSIRRRSRSPSKSGLVARGVEAQSQTLGSSAVAVSQPQTITEANGAASPSQGEDPQALGPV
ncbi:hypothetical protein RHMOL_Rhmol01G0004700 [Rhododendron molle]|uniref:Uncharacterized protein n=1 Tax=Rhododendron molle TaxID=49168 RepID=A0ACC0PZI9_RHOML|nr:hypothetical protein RHMOL_Rhmol01G0004700 [Rhododendron molle]